jgi:hypothetical protein
MKMNENCLRYNEKNEKHSDKKKRSSNKNRWFVPLKRKKINDVKKRNNGADTNIFDPGLNPSVQKEQRNQRKK